MFAWPRRSCDAVVPLDVVSRPQEAGKAGNEQLLMQPAAAADGERLTDACTAPEACISGSLFSPGDAQVGLSCCLTGHISEIVFPLCSYM